MVNETDGLLSAVNGDAANRKVCLCPSVDVGKRLSIFNGIVFHFQGGMGVDAIHNELVCLLHAVILGKGNAPLQDVVDVCSSPTLGVGQQIVAAGKCQTTLFTHDGARHDLQGEAQILNHATNDGYLLEIFLPEISAGGFHPGKELGNNLADPIEVSRPKSALHDSVCGRIGELPRVGFGIDLVHRWCEGDGCSAVSQEVAI